MSEIHYVTAEGLEKLKGELAQLIAQRPVISKQIAEARDKGDLSENAEYDAAKEAQGLLELKISKLENTIANARVIDESRINTEQIQMLNKVKHWWVKVRLTSERASLQLQHLSVKHSSEERKVM